jgi:outer membrane lipoprotein-sorting protein
MKKLLAIILLIIMAGCQQRQVDEKQSPQGAYHHEPKKPEHVIVIEKTNANINSIRTLTADVRTITRRRSLAITSNGKLYFQKDHNFRLISHQVTDNRLGSDMGSNKDYFWFYIRRLGGNELHYARYVDLNRTNLKSSLHPLWMMESINLLPIDTNRIKASKQKDNWMVWQMRVSPKRHQIAMISIINPSKFAITAHYVEGGSNGQVLASSEVKGFNRVQGIYVPRTIEFSLFEDDIKIVQEFSNVRINVPISAEMWKMPDLGIRTVNLASGVVIRGVND